MTDTKRQLAPEPWATTHFERRIRLGAVTATLHVRRWWESGKRALKVSWGVSIEGTYHDAIEGSFESNGDLEADLQDATSQAIAGAGKLADQLSSISGALRGSKP